MVRQKYVNDDGKGGQSVGKVPVLLTVRIFQLIHAESHVIDCTDHGHRNPFRTVCVLRTYVRMRRLSRYFTYFIFFNVSHRFRRLIKVFFFKEKERTGPFFFCG